jgi:hypothetical protein
MIDPDGRSTESTIVTKQEDGTYKVVGGNKDDGDNGIYLQNADGSNGELIGYSATPESFYWSDRDQWAGTINPNDQSGRTFLNESILKGDPNLIYYMYHARRGQKYDFKQTNGSNTVYFEDTESQYRGMPILGNYQDKPIYASARDVGNIGAGLVAGRTGMGWATARLGLDALESYQKGELRTESTSTQYGQKLGHRIGYQIHEQELRRLPGNGHLGGTISSDPVMKDDLQN